MRHCELNPIELIWAQVKRYVAFKNFTFKMKDVRYLTNDALASITPDAWKNLQTMLSRSRVDVVFPRELLKQFHL